jgi:PAS domain S-box-containing protein
MISRKPQSSSPHCASAAAALKRLNVGTASRWVTLLTVATCAAVALPGAQLHDLWLAGGAACTVALVTLPALREPRRAMTVLLAGNLLLAVGLSGDYQQRTAYALLQYLSASNAGALLPRVPAFVSSALLGVGFLGAKATVLHTHGFTYGPDVIATDVAGFFMLTTLSYLLAASQRQIESLHSQLAEKTQQTENELQVTLALSRDMVVVLDVEGKILSISPACEATLGYSPEELVGRHTADLIHPDDRRRSAGARQDLLATGGLIRFESRYLHKNGQEEWLEWHAGRFEGESIIRCVARNITERKRADVERARLVAILEATTDYVSIISPGGGGLYLNQAGREITGIRGSEAWALDRLYPARSLAVMEHQAIPTAMRDGAWSGEITWLDSSGGEVPVSQVVLAHKGPDGSVEYLSAIARDISERQRHAAELTFRETHDSLTGLLNRRGFVESLNAGLIRTPDGRGAVLHIDLDEFKDINSPLPLCSCSRSRRTSSPPPQPPQRRYSNPRRRRSPPLRSRASPRPGCKYPGPAFSPSRNRRPARERIGSPWRLPSRGAAQPAPIRPPRSKPPRVSSRCRAPLRKSF